MMRRWLVVVMLGVSVRAMAVEQGTEVVAQVDDGLALRRTFGSFVFAGAAAAIGSVLTFAETRPCASASRCSSFSHAYQITSMALTPSAVGALAFAGNRLFGGRGDVHHALLGAWLGSIPTAMLYAAGMALVPRTPSLGLPLIITSAAVMSFGAALGAERGSQMLELVRTKGEQARARFPFERMSVGAAISFLGNGVGSLVLGGSLNTLNEPRMPGAAVVGIAFSVAALAATPIGVWQAHQRLGGRGRWWAAFVGQAAALGVAGVAALVAWRSIEQPSNPFSAAMTGGAFSIAASALAFGPALALELSHDRQPEPEDAPKSKPIFFRPSFSLAPMPGGGMMTIGGQF